MLKKPEKKKKLGQSLVEYGLIIAIESIVAMAVFQTMGDSIVDYFTTFSQRIEQANTTAQD